MSVPDVITPLTQAQASGADAMQAAIAQLTLIGNQAATIASLAAQLRDASHRTGTTRYFQLTSPLWDQYLNTSDPALQATMSAECQRMGVFTTFFDWKLLWYPNALVYFDSYAIYNPSTVATQHPEWILKDTAGNRLYIPWGCSNGTCPQYAGDVGNPAFVAWQIAQIRTYLAASGTTPSGYKGLWLDDVNMALAVSNGNGQLVTPKDPRTGQLMTPANWRLYFAQYVEAIRVAFPAIEILHNSVWFTARDLPNDPYIRRQHVAADYINIERGFGDAGITGGTGSWSLYTLMKYIDFVHSLGRAIVAEDYYALDLSYSLACYYLVQSGKDFQGFGDLVPTGWPSNLSLDLGAATSNRYVSNGLWMRDFANGRAYVCEPGAANVTIALQPPMIDESGATVNSISLSAKTGRLLRKAA